MPVRIRTKFADYEPAAVIHQQVGLGPTALLRFVVQGKIRTKIDPRWDYPLYSVKDAKAAFRDRPQQHQSDALTHTNRGGGRPRKAAKT